MSQRGAGQSLNTSNLADLLERILDKGVVIAGDVKVKLVDIELLTIQIRLVICSVDKAKEMGMDWWANRAIIEPSKPAADAAKTIDDLQARLARLEAELESARQPVLPAPPEPAKPWRPPSQGIRTPSA